VQFTQTTLAQQSEPAYYVHPNGATLRCKTCNKYYPDKCLCTKQNHQDSGSDSTGGRVDNEKVAKGLLSFVEMDLSKGEGHHHPDINQVDKYLCLISDQWYFGTFSLQWYGLYFSNVVQYDQPGTNSSRWQRVLQLSLPVGGRAATIADEQTDGGPVPVVSDITDLQDSNRQAWGICDAVAQALGTYLDKEAGSAASVTQLITELAHARTMCAELEKELSELRERF
jgi:hypothetical protein